MNRHTDPVQTTQDGHFLPTRQDMDPFMQAATRQGMEWGMPVNGTTAWLMECDDLSDAYEGGR